MSLFYEYFCVYNWFSKIFGLKKPFPDHSGNPKRVTCLHKFWSIIIIICLVTSYALSVKEVGFSIKRNLYWISQTNDFLVATVSLFMYLLEGDEVCINLYETVDVIFVKLKISDQSVKIFCVKLYLLLMIPFIMYVICLIWEIMTMGPPFYQLVTRIPLFLSIIHYLIHYWVMIAALNAVNRNMSKKLVLMVNNYKNKKILLKEEKPGLLKYFLNTNVKFPEVECDVNLDIKLICTVYDELCTCVKLLEMHHGYQTVLTAWLIFSSTVCVATLLIFQQAERPLMLALICVLPYVWSLMCAHADNLMRCEVECLENLIVKFLIDFRCDQPRRNILQVLKQQVTSNRLQYLACGVISINYSTMLGTVMNIITYTVILIQMFLRED